MRKTMRETMLDALPLTSRDLVEGRRGLLAWALGIVGAVLLYLPFYPSVGSAEMVQTYVDAFSPELSRVFGLDRMTSGAGYTQATYFGLTGYLLLAIAAVGWGAQAVAGDEESGSLELTLAHGVSRFGLIAQRALAIVIRLVVLSHVGWLMVVALSGPSQLELNAGHVAAASLALLALSLLVALFALAVGAATGRRSFAAAAGAGLAVLAYVLDAVAVTARLPWLQRLSPYHWAYGNDPISTGVDWFGLVLLFGVGAALFAFALWSFSRRDVSG